MRRKFPTLILLLALAACEKVERADQAQITPAPEQPASAPAPTPTPQPAPPTDTPPPPPAPRLAPEGIFFVLQRVNITTDSGVIGLKPGTQVKLVRKTDTEMVMTDGTNEFTILPQGLTNDLDVAARLAKADAAATTAASSASNAAAATNAELNKAQAALRDLQSRRQILEAEEARILKQIDAGSDAQNRYAIAKAKGAPIQQDPIIVQLPTLRARLDKVRSDINALK